MPTGKVDAIFSHGAHAADIKAFLGARVVIDLGKHPGIANSELHTTPPPSARLRVSSFQRNPDRAARWLANVIEAAEWAAVASRRNLPDYRGRNPGTPKEITREAYGELAADSLVP